MPQPVQHQTVQHEPVEHPSRGRFQPRLPRTRDEVFAATTVVLAVLAAVLAIAGAYDVGVVVALACVVVGGWSQMISETRYERFESVIAVGFGAVTLAICLANGSGLWT